MVLHKEWIVWNPSFPLVQWDWKKNPMLHIALLLEFWLIRIVATDWYLFRGVKHGYNFLHYAWLHEWIVQKLAFFFAIGYYSGLLPFMAFFSEKQTHSVLKSEGRLNSFQNLTHWAKQDVWLSSTIASFCFSWAVIRVFQLNWIHIFFQTYNNHIEY